MQNNPRPRQNVPMICWKCHTENNLSVSKFCSKCNSHLELFQNKSVRFSNKKPSIFGKILKVLVLILVISFFAGYLAIRYFVPQYPELSAYKPLAYLSDTVSNGSKTITLPANSWYLENPWSHIRYYPTIGEIIRKNNEAVGGNTSPDMVKTLSISGTFSVSRGDCVTQDCYINYQRMVHRQNRMYFDAEDERKFGFARTLPQTIGGGVINDDAYQRSYNDFGSVEGYLKKPDKSLRRIKVKIPFEGYKSSEITEGLSSDAGWKSTKNINNLGQVSEEIKDLNQEQSKKLQEELISMWQAATVNTDSIKFKDLEMVNDRAVFVLTRENKNQMVESLYFDSVDGQIIKIESAGTATYFTNFKQFNGVTLPSTMYSRRVEIIGGFVLWLKFDQIEWKINEEVDDSIFEKPQTSDSGKTKLAKN